MAEAHPGPIEGLLADVVMPKVTGPELAERLTRTHRETKVVFMSSYTTDAMGQYRIMNTGAPFLGKPFTAALLARKLREALDYRSPFKRPPAPIRTASPAFA